MDFVDGLKTVAGAGDARARTGIAIHVYTCNASMENRCKGVSYEAVSSPEFIWD